MKIFVDLITRRIFDDEEILEDWLRQYAKFLKRRSPLDNQVVAEIRKGQAVAWQTLDDGIPTENSFRIVREGH